ncbi:MAG: PstS family phosphate ABC transporter substrate-binding protein [Elusimicrobiota bacterium]
MKKILTGVLCLCLFIGQVWSADEITIEGSTTVLPIAQATAERYMDMNKDSDISVRGGGSGVGIASLISGSCDVADASRAIKDKELDQAVSKGIDPVAHVVAMDGIAVIVHPSNSIKGLTKKQLKDIYTGKLSRWSELNISEKSIVVVSRDSASGTFEAFNGLALDNQKVRADALLEASNKAVAAVVATTPGAIGYVGLGYVTQSVKKITIDGIVCDKNTVLSGKYTLGRPLFMYTNGAPKGAVKDYLDYVLSEEGQKIVEEAGYIGIK